MQLPSVNPVTFQYWWTPAAESAKLPCYDIVRIENVHVWLGRHGRQLRPALDGLLAWQSMVWVFCHEITIMSHNVMFPAACHPQHASHIACSRLQLLLDVQLHFKKRCFTQLQIPSYVRAPRHTTVTRHSYLLSPKTEEHDAPFALPCYSPWVMLAFQTWLKSNQSGLLWPGEEFTISTDSV